MTLGSAGLARAARGGARASVMAPIVESIVWIDAPARSASSASRASRTRRTRHAVRDKLRVAHSFISWRARGGRRSPVGSAGSWIAARAAFKQVFRELRADARRAGMRARNRRATRAAGSSPASRRDPASRGWVSAPDEGEAPARACFFVTVSRANCASAWVQYFTEKRTAKFHDVVRARRQRPPQGCAGDAFSEAIETSTCLCRARSSRRQRGRPDVIGHVEARTNLLRAISPALAPVLELRKSHVLVKGTARELPITSPSGYSRGARRLPLHHSGPGPPRPPRPGPPSLRGGRPPRPPRS